MTDDQMRVFVRSAQMGTACGLTRLSEFLVNSNRALHHGPYHEIAGKAAELNAAYVAFWRGTAGDPEEEELLRAATDEEVLDLIFK